MPGMDQPRRVHLDADKCARSHLIGASCQACADLCPVNAIDLAGRTPRLDEWACRDCGACVGICPEQAFSMRGPWPVAAGSSEVLVTLNEDSAAGIFPALALGFPMLARLWLQGVRTLVMSPADCPADLEPACARLLWRIDAFNSLIRNRQGDEIQITRARLSASRTVRRGRDAPTNPARRALFRRFVDVGESPEDVTGAENDTKTALAQVLAIDQTALMPFSPRIDPIACTGCDACVLICPHGALTVVKAQNGELAYTSKPEFCTGCQLCADICEEGAIDIQTMTLRGKDVPLCAYQCKGCGVAVHTPRARPPADCLCQICQKTQNHKQLFVVLE